FIEGTISEARGLNPLKVGDASTSERVGQLLDGGCFLKDKDTIHPEWFEKWELSDSLDRINYKLRPNLSWGEPWGQLTAEDYMVSITELFHPQTAWYPYTYSYNFNVGGEPIKFRKTGKLTLEADLPQPRPFMFYNSDIKYVYPIPKEIVKEYADTQNANALDQDPAVVNCKFNGNLGPYDLKNWNRQSVIVFTRNEDYYKRKWADDKRYDRDYSKSPYFEEDSMQVFDSETTKRSALKAGQIHYSGLPGRKLEEFQANKDIYVRTSKFVGFSCYMGINERANGWEPLRNRTIRHALANVYNRKTIVNEIMNGKGAVQGTLHPAWGPYYPDNIYTPEWTISRAKELFDKGTSNDYGYSGGTFVGPEGEQVELTLAMVGGDTTDQLKSQYLKQRLNKAGFGLNIEAT
ncbi:MAG: ABC transporter substrate-binding protein, partial [Halobacteriaceae archaeon]